MVCCCHCRFYDGLGFNRYYILPFKRYDEDKRGEMDYCMSFQYKAIDHVQLAAPKGGEDRARDFFVNLLGFKEIEKPELLRKNGGVWFMAGAIQLHIGVEGDFVPAKKAHPAFRVENIDELKEYLDGKNVKYINDDRLPGANRFYLNDPFDNRLEFLEWID